MSKQTFEFELLDGGRDKPAVQQLQSSGRWPYPPVHHHEEATCEMQYRAFRDAYNRAERSVEICDGHFASPRLTDSELRMRWLEYYQPFKLPTQRQLEGFAREVSGAGTSPLSGLSSNDKSLIYAIIAIALCLLILL